MYNHAPKNYDCPFCRIVRGAEDDSMQTREKDVFYQDKFITAFISSGWRPKNKGHALIIPNRHYENLYDLTDTLAAKIHAFSRRVAVALKETYKCDGVTVRQHNEPAGSQGVWHYHLHVFPRYVGDGFFSTEDRRIRGTPAQRAAYSRKLRRYFDGVK